MTHKESNSSGRIPRSESDDYTPDAVARRRAWLAARTGAVLEALVDAHTDPRMFRGNIENLVGTMAVPVGLAGPFIIRGQNVSGGVYVPLATTEGALVASYGRGMKAISACGGARTRIVRAALTAGASFLFDGLDDAHAFAAWMDRSTEALRARAEATTRHGKFLRVETRVVGRRVFANFVYETGDALGINMATVATAAACEWIMAAAQPRPILQDLPGGMQGEKWANALDYLEGRGRHVAAEATISSTVLCDQLRADAVRIHAAWLTMTLAKTQAAGLGTSFHVANAIAALMLATGQDLAYLSALAATVVMEALPAGDLYISIDLPTLGVGTVGGGTGLPGPRACLEIMGCAGAGKANRLAEIVAATCLAGEISTVAAIVSGEFVKAHERLGRNRPIAPSGRSQ